MASPNQNKETISIRLNPAERETIDGLAESMGVTRSEFIETAVRFYSELQQWQIERIEGRVAAAKNENEFASEDEVEEFFESLLK